jgi:hypothetical protein
METTDKTFKGLTDLQRQLPSEKAACQYWAAMRWPDGAICPYCFSKAVYVFTDGKRFKCKEEHCKQIFSIRVGTCMEGSNVPVRKWVLAVYLMCESSKGISSIQLANLVGVTQKTGWFMSHRIREMMFKNAPEKLAGVVEGDTTFIGGKKKNMHASKAALLPTGGASHMTPVYGLLQRNGNVIAQVIGSESKEFIAPLIFQHVKPTASLMLDTAKVYTSLPKGAFKIKQVNHSAGEYVRGKVHTQGIESFWSNLKRGYVGVYHYWSPEHLHRYLNEYTARHNNRKAGKGAKTNAVLRNSEGKLTWKMLTGK